VHTTEWDREELRETLQAIMERADLSQAAVGQLAGRNRTMANRWLGGQSRPTYEAATAFATAIGETYPDLTHLADRFLRAAGYRTPSEDGTPPEDVNLTAKRLLTRLRELADKQDKSIGDILVERGLATRDELMLSEEKRGDRFVKDILSSNLPEDTKNKILMDYVIDRRHSFRDAGLIGPPKEK
jgi:transcriptional regulator with XRE-family HTH domain